MNNKERRWWNLAMARVLARRMEERGMTANALAREAGLSSSTVNTALGGVGMTSWLSLYMMLRTLKCEEGPFLTSVADEYKELAGVFKP